jgi:uncharacterized membrane protein YfhO
MGENMRKNMAISINNIPVKNDPDTGSKTVSMPINSTKPTTITLTFNRGLNQIDLDHFALYTLNRTAFKQTIATAKQKAPKQRIQNGRVTLTTKANNSGYIMLTIPYEKGWQVNSKNVTLQNYRGFIGLKVPTSRSTFTLTYHTPGITQGWWLTIIGVLVAIGVTVYEYWPSKRRHLKQTKRI